MKNVIVCLKKKNFIIAFILIFMLVAHIFLYFGVDSYKNVFDTFNDKIFNSFNFGEQNFTDSDAVFVFNEKSYFKSKGEVKLFLPSSESYVLDNGSFSFDSSKNFIIKSSGDGIVKEVGTLDNGLKYIVIKHSNEIFTRYENLKIVGVGENFIVKNVNPIGTTSVDEPLVFAVYKNNKIITNIKIENGELKWDD